MTNLTIIVACDAERGIGINNTLPWHIPGELPRFKRITTGHAIIMGRKTFESIGRPLPNRRNIVLTRNKDWQHDDIEVVNSLSAAMQLIGDSDAFVIGGADIYAQAMPLCRELLVTEIHHNFKCDAFFPVIDKTQWQEVERITQHCDKNKFDYSFVTYRKVD